MSRSWRQVLAHAAQVAKVDTTVLLTGESGTGKEVVARFTPNKEFFGTIDLELEYRLVPELASADRD